MSVVTPPHMLAPQRLDHIQALRGIAALMVVVSHLFITEKKYSADQILGGWARYGMAGVDLFFVISGFIMVYVMWDRPRGIKAASEFLWGRAARIYPLYWLISLVLLALWFIRPDMVFSSIEILPDILKSFALFPDEREPLLAVGWTLVHEMYFYLVFAGIMLLPRKALLPCLVLWFVVVIGFGNHQAAEPRRENDVLDLVLNSMTLEFIVGALFALTWKFGETSRKLSPAPKFEYILANILIVIGVVWLIWEAAAMQNFPSNGLRGLKLAVPCGLIVMGFASRDFTRQAIWKPLVTLGDWSYALYLTHVLSLTVMGRIWAYFKNDSLLDNAAVLLFMVAVTIIISGLVYHYAERPMINAAKKMRRRLFAAPPA